MSRIIVKNLPKMVTEEKLREHFSDVDTITDVKLMYNKFGQLRGFAFIGFESETAAKRACDLFQNTYFKQNKIVVEICSDLDHKAREAAKKEKERNERLQKKKEMGEKYEREIFQKSQEVTKEKLKEYINDPDFIHYMELHEKGTSNLVHHLKEKYSGDVETPAEDDDSEEGSDHDEEKKETKLAMSGLSDLEYLKRLTKPSEESDDDKSQQKKMKWDNLFTVVLRTKEKNTSRKKKGQTLTKAGVKAFLKPIVSKSLRIPQKLSYVAYVGLRTEKDVKQVLMKDKSFLDGVRVRIHRYVNKNEENPQNNAPWKEAENKLLNNASSVAESGKLFVRNLWYSVTEEEVREHFGKIGPLADVTVPVSKLNRKPKGFAHVTYVLPEHAVRAMNELDGMVFKGRVLHVLPSMHNEEMDDDESNPKSFREKRKDDLKKSASSWHNWNSLFLGSSAVIDLMAENFGTSKQALFDDEGEQSAAVTLALGETQIIDETKKFLEEEGVSLEAFSTPGVQRSSTVMLSKNLPAKTSAHELKELFGKFGELGRVVLPPSGVTALIEFIDPGEAKKAFKGLAYSRFKHLPLYLEWAPISVFKESVAIPQTKKEPVNESTPEDTTEGTESSLVAPEDNTTLYLKNLNFQSEEKDIQEVFERIGPVSSVLISRRRGLSQGFGFVQYVKQKDAKKALKELNNVSLHNKNILVKFSEKILTNPVSKTSRKMLNPGDPVTPKLLVKNIPFQATQKEVGQLFKTFGELKSIRLPTKPGASFEHRGFGFVEFLTKEDAKRAFEALGPSTHLYGRRLVLEWAKEEETVEELRKKTAERFLNTDARPKKRAKVEIGNENEYG